MRADFYTDFNATKREQRNNPVHIRTRFRADFVQIWLHVCLHICLHKWVPPPWNRHFDEILILKCRFVCTKLQEMCNEMCNQICNVICMILCWVACKLLWRFLRYEEGGVKKSGTHSNKSSCRFRAHLFADLVAGLCAEICHKSAVT